MKKTVKSLRNPNRKPTHPGAILRDEKLSDSNVGLVDEYCGGLRTPLPENSIFNTIVAALDHFESKIQLIREDVSQ